MYGPKRYQFGEYVRVGVTWKLCDFLPQEQCLMMLRYHMNKFNPFAKVLFRTITRHICITSMAYVVLPNLVYRPKEVFIACVLLLSLVPKLTPFRMGVWAQDYFYQPGVCLFLASFALLGMCMTLFVCSSAFCNDIDLILAVMSL